MKFGFKIKIKIDYTQLHQFLRIQADSFGQTVKTQIRPLPGESDQSFLLTFPDFQSMVNNHVYQIWTWCKCEICLEAKVVVPIEFVGRWWLCEHSERNRHTQIVTQEILNKNWDLTWQGFSGSRTPKALRGYCVLKLYISSLIYRSLMTLWT